MTTNQNLANYYQDAVLSNSTYPTKGDNGETIELKLGDVVQNTNYQVIATTSTSSGYQAYAFKDTVTGQVTIAHRGSELWGVEAVRDWSTNIFGIGSGAYVPQQVKDAIEFNNRVIAQLEQKAGHVIDPSTIKQTGHSLGGALAQLVAVMNGSEAVTFDAPTVKHLINNLQQEYPGKFDNIDYDALKNKITEIKETDDFVANIPGYTARLGTLVTVDTPRPLDVTSFPHVIATGLSGLLTLKVISDFDAHRIGHLLSFIESQVTNTPLSQEQVNQYGEVILAIIENLLESSLLESLSNSAISDTIQLSLNSLSTAQTIAPARVDPLVLDLNNNNNIDLISLSNSNSFFDLNDDGFLTRVGWVKAEDGMLFLDENNNGVVDNHSELFGYTDKVTKAIVTGTEELSTYDLNHDQIINNQDAIFNRLKVWQDLNQDGKSQAGELKTLTELNIKQLNLSNLSTKNQNIDGNMIFSEGSYVTTDNQTHKLANVGLDANNTNSVSYIYQDSAGNVIGNYNLNLNSITLPLSRGYGTVEAFHIAMSKDQTLLTQMQNIVNNKNHLENLDQQIEDFIYRWTQTDNIPAAENRGVFSSRKIAVLEKIRGEAFTNVLGSNSVLAPQFNLVNQAWNLFFNEIKAKILIQGTFKEAFGNVNYNLATDKFDLNNITIDQLMTNLKGFYDDNFDTIINKAYFVYNIEQTLKDRFNLEQNEIKQKIIANFGQSYNLINSGTGHDYINAEVGDDIIEAGDGNDTILAGAGNDIINAGTGDDYMAGVNAGDDIYLYNKGDGKDVILEDYGSGNGTDKISFGANIRREDVYFTKDNNGNSNDLVIRFKDNNSDHITIRNHFRPEVDYRVETLAFSDGTSMDISNPNNLSLIFNGSEANDVIYAGASDDIINAYAGNDNIYAYSGNDIINSGTGHDYINAEVGDDKLNGGLGIDTLIGGAGKDSFIFDSIESSNNSNPDLIMDFLHSEDLIDFSAISSINSISDLNVTNDGVNTLIDDQNSDFAVKLSGVKLLAADDFIFHG